MKRAKSMDDLSRDHFDDDVAWDRYILDSISGIMPSTSAFNSTTSKLVTTMFQEINDSPLSERRLDKKNKKNTKRKRSQSPPSPVHHSFRIVVKLPRSSFESLTIPQISTPPQPVEMSPNHEKKSPSKNKKESTRRSWHNELRIETPEPSTSWHNELRIETPEPSTSWHNELRIETPEPSTSWHNELRIETPEPSTSWHNELRIETPEPSTSWQNELRIETPEPSTSCGPTIITLTDLRRKVTKKENKRQKEMIIRMKLPEKPSPLLPTYSSNPKISPPIETHHEPTSTTLHRKKNSDKSQERPLSSIRSFYNVWSVTQPWAMLPPHYPTPRDQQ